MAAGLPAHDRRTGVVGLRHRQADAAHRVRRQAVVQQRVTQPHLRHEREHLDLADIADLHIVGIERELEADIAIEIDADRYAGAVM